MMTVFTPGLNPQVPPESDAAITAWMGNQGWKVIPPRWEMDPDGGFHVWQEDEPVAGRSHALWVSESMVRHLSADQLVKVLNSEDMAEEMRISFKVRIQERGDEYRVSIVPRASGGWRKPE
jgi:hypothetical protein